MRIDEALAGEKSLAVTFPTGAVLNVVYVPTAYTVADVAGLDEEARKDPRRIVRMVREIVRSWDLEDREGPVPLEAPEPVAEFEEAPTSTGTNIVLKPRDEKEVMREELLADPIARRVPIQILTRIIRAVHEDQAVSEGE